MLFRLKIVKCLDILVESSSIDEVLKENRELIKKCREDSKLYIHVLERTSGEIIDRGMVYSSTVKDVLHHMLQQYDQP